MSASPIGRVLFSPHGHVDLRATPVPPVGVPVVAVARLRFSAGGSEPDVFDEGQCGGDVLASLAACDELVDVIDNRPSQGGAGDSPLGNDARP
jgi:hypothetical protein